MQSLLKSRVELASDQPVEERMLLQLDKTSAVLLSAFYSWTEVFRVELSRDRQSVRGLSSAASEVLVNRLGTRVAKLMRLEGLLISPMYARLQVVTIAKQDCHREVKQVWAQQINALLSVQLLLTTAAILDENSEQLANFQEKPVTPSQSQSMAPRRKASFRASMRQLVICSLPNICWISQTLMQVLARSTIVMKAQKAESAEEKPLYLSLSNTAFVVSCKSPMRLTTSNRLRATVEMTAMMTKKNFLLFIKMASTCVWSPVLAQRQNAFWSEPSSWQSMKVVSVMSLRQKASVVLPVSMGIFWGQAGYFWAEESASKVKSNEINLHIFYNSVSDEQVLLFV